MAGNNGGPWGGGGSGGGRPTGGGNNGSGGGGGGGREPGDGQNIPEIDEIVRKGQEQLRVLMGGRGDQGNRRSNGSGGGDGGPRLTRGTVAIGFGVAFVLWFLASFYTVQPEQQGVELFLGEYYRTTDDGPHLAPWPLVTAEVVDVTTNRTVRIGTNDAEEGLMLTTNINVVDIEFTVVWNIADPAQFLFTLEDPEMTVRAVSEAAMREVVALSPLAPILSTNRSAVAEDVRLLIQETMDSYESGIYIVRVNFDEADPPAEVIDAFLDVVTAGQERIRLERQADGYANRVVAEARGEAAQVLEDAEAYRAQVVNEAQGEASRFLSVLEEYQAAPEVTRRRLYLETLERVLADVDLVILDNEGQGGGNGVVPYLPLNELRTQRTTTAGSSN